MKAWYDGNGFVDQEYCDGRNYVVAMVSRETSSRIEDRHERSRSHTDLLENRKSAQMRCLLFCWLLRKG